MLHILSVLVSSPTNPCSTAMLAAKRSAGVEPEVNLREHVMQARIRLPTLALKPRSQKQVYQWPHKKDLCPPKIF